jgi:hypothetical protein
MPITPEDALRGVVLVEGSSDRAAVITLAERHGMDLYGQGIAVVEMGGATAIGPHLACYGPSGLGLRLAGLYDAGEADVVRRRLGRARLCGAQTAGARPTADMEPLGFFMCVKDLEDELIRAVGVDAIEQVVALGGNLRSFRTFQSQPGWRDRPIDQQFRRFLGAGSQRKIRYARLLVQCIDLARMPRPLDAVIEHVQRWGEPQ